jgi:hypothetical protein
MPKQPTSTTDTKRGAALKPYLHSLGVEKTTSPSMTLTSSGGARNPSRPPMGLVDRRECGGHT